ncbi:MAG: ABC transporter permease [Gammaproteobacteria bacterium]|nr:ABC transporter permease [Gammaproteobacteria bacterium]
MSPKLVAHLTRAFLRIYMRDRQAIILGLVFPIVLLSAFGVVQGREPDVVEVGVIDRANSASSTDFIGRLTESGVFDVEVDTESELRHAVRDGNKTLVIDIPADFDNRSSIVRLKVLVNAEEVRSLGFVVPLLERSLLDIERQIRGTQPMFELNVEDVDARGLNYLDFVFPGILAFALMQLSIAGSAYNVVEYRRKGILKRLFVTPLRAGDFILSISLARMVFAMVQLTVVVLFAVFVLEIQIVGSIIEFLVTVALGMMIFLCLGFSLGSLAETQQAIGAMGSLVTFPQIVLSGVFFPIDRMPDLIQPVANILPLSFVVSALREISANGASLLQLLPDVAGMLVWLVIFFVLAARLFSWRRVAT